MMTRLRDCGRSNIDGIQCLRRSVDKVVGRCYEGEMFVKREVNWMS